jgi:hypothetical protein
MMLRQFFIDDSIKIYLFKIKFYKIFLDKNTLIHSNQKSNMIFSAYSLNTLSFFIFSVCWLCGYVYLNFEGLVFKELKGDLKCDLEV